MPIAIGILAASGQISADRLTETEFIGELSLGGDLHSISGVLPVAIKTSNANRVLVVPFDNGAEASLISNIVCKTAHNLLEVCLWLNKMGDLKNAEKHQSTNTEAAADLSDVKGQLQAKRALEIAASGGHNLFILCPIK